MCTRHCRYLNIDKCQGSYLYHCANALCTQPKNIETLCNSLTKVVVNDEPSLRADILKTSGKFQNILEMFATCHKLYDRSHVGAWHA